MVTRWFVEKDAHCRNVLARHWPDVPIYGDITAVNWSEVESVDILVGGFPCQPISIAGRGGAQEDDRWLWPSFADAIRHLRPRYVLVENVRNLLAVNGGTAFSEILGDLATGGYDAEWDCIPAVAVGAPHERDRLWLVAYRPELNGVMADTDDRRPRDPIRSRRDAVGDGGTERMAGRRDTMEKSAGERYAEPRQLIFAEHSASLADWSSTQSEHAGWWKLNPSWVEWLMGFPIGWSDCGHSVTRSCLKSSSGSVGALLPSTRR